MTDTQAEAPAIPANDELAIAAQAHAVRIAVAEYHTAKAKRAAEDARLGAQPDFAAARNRGLKTTGVVLPDGTEVGTLSIYAGETEVYVREDELILCARPDELQEYVLPAALHDPRALKLLADFLPELVGRRIELGVRAQFETELRERGGTVADHNTGDRVAVATITRHDATGRCQYKPGKQAEHQIAAAIDAGQITPDGRIVPPPAPEPEPAAAGPEPEPEVRAIELPPVQREVPAASPAAAVTPTDEQQAINSAYQDGGNLVVNAYAGSGKTTILRMLAGVSPDRQFTYVAYNKAAKKDAAASFPVNARCYTSHGLAFKPMIHMAERIGASKYIPGIQLAKLMNITGPARLTKDRVLAPGQVASVVKATVMKFCYSADETVTGRHVPRDLKRFTDPEEIAALQEIIPPLARRLWEQDITTAGGVMPMEHDYYLKAYALTHPRLPGDVIALDEAQDSNPCVAAMIREQAAYGIQLILVGDSFQAIYGWRGATDVMRDFAQEPGVTVLPITQSFRFGAEIAAEGNKWLQILGAPHPLRGFDKIRSRIGQVSGTGDAVLCRTNAEALKQAIAAIGKGLKVAFPKGTGDLVNLTRGAADIKAGRPSEHPDLMAFATWGQVQDFVQNEPGGEDLRLFADLVDEHGTDALLAILSQIGNEEKGAKADLTISTAHSAKGREWPMVEIAGDFLEPKRDPEAPAGRLPVIPREMAMLAYVAVTRAQRVLDRAGLAWVDNYLPGGAR